MIASISLLLAILVGYWASTVLTSGTQKKEVTVTASSTLTTPPGPIKSTKGMTKVELIFRTVLYLALLIVGVLIWEKYNLGAYWKAYWMNNPFIQTIVYAGMVNFVIYKFFPDFWWDNLCSWSAVLFYSMIALSLTAGGKIGKIIAALLLLTFIIHLIGWNLEDKIEELRAKWGANRGDQTASVLRRAPYTPTGTTKYPKGESWPDKDVAEKTLAGQWDLLAACYQESGLKQFNPDGSVVTNTNNNGTTDVGICQINSVHDEELKRLKLDKTKLRDNLVFALILYNKEGLRPWATPPGSKLVFEVEVTKKESNTFRLPKVIMGFEHKKPIFIAFNDESHVAKEIANELDLTPFTPITDYKFMSATDEKVVVTVTYDYK